MMCFNPKHKRQILHQKQHGKCIYCGVHMWLPNSKKRGKKSRMATIEHILPVSKGGKTKDNLVCSCFGCNSRRRSYNHFEFMGTIQKYGKEKGYKIISDILSYRSRLKWRARMAYI